MIPHPRARAHNQQIFEAENEQPSAEYRKLAPRPSAAVSNRSAWQSCADKVLAGKSRKYRFLDYLPSSALILASCLVRMSPTLSVRRVSSLIFCSS